MPRPGYPEATKAHAMKLAEQVGRSEAARRTGIPAGTIASWMSRAGIASVATSNLRKATEARKMTMEERRVRLSDTLLSLAEKAIGTADTRIDEASLRDLVGAWDYAIKNSQLLAGHATARTEALSKETAHHIADELEERRRKTA